MHLSTVNIIILWIFYGSVYSFPGGGPAKSCANLYPKHHTDAQLSPPPYTISASQEYYNPTDTITVTISSNDGTPFTGFMLRANRLHGDTEEIVGKFIESAPNGTVREKFWYPQEEDSYNCITHSSSADKTDVTVKWQAPDTTLGDIQFFGAVVKDYSHFWVMIPSPVIIAEEILQTAGKTHASAVAQSLRSVELKDCGVTKGCMLYPSLCSGSSCTTAVTYKAQDDGVEFEAMAPAQGYLTFAISKNELMGEDETITCIAENEHLSVQHGYNPGYYNDRHRVVNFTNMEVGRVDGKIICKWTMPYENTLLHQLDYLDPPETHPKIFNLREKYTLFLAWGKIYLGADVLGKHTELPLVSHEAVDVTKVSICRAKGLYTGIKFHAFMMLLGYLTLMSIGVVVSRHYQTVFTNHLLGTKVWFQVHRGIMISSGIAIVIGIIVIFVTIGGWTKVNTNHAIVGLFATFLVLLNVIAGFLRPGKESKYRPIFKWVHRIAGKCTQILSAATICLSLSTAYLNETLKCYLAIVFTIWIVAQFVWEFLIYEAYAWSLCRNNFVENKSSDSQEMEAMSSKEIENSEKSDSSQLKDNSFWNLQFFIHCIVILAATVASAVFLFLF